MSEIKDFQELLQSSSMKKSIFLTPELYKIMQHLYHILEMKTDEIPNPATYEEIIRTFMLAFLKTQTAIMSSMLFEIERKGL